MGCNQIQFLLNHHSISLDNVDPNLTVLQYLRDHLALTGTKEGCASGDCGACTVVVAKLSDTQPSELIYQSINACITFIGTLHGKQLITVEHLKQGSNLHPVQQSMVDNDGSQCGFCTPGIVMSSFALNKNNPSPNRKQVVEALAGNLCRCTGYRSIIDSALQSVKQSDSFAEQSSETIRRLLELQQLPVPSKTNTRKNNSKQSYNAPKNCHELSKILLKKPNSSLVAGGTDLALSVTQSLETIEHLVYLGDVAELNLISETKDYFTVGAAVSYSRFYSAVAKDYPELSQMIERIGSTQIRNSGTIGGNIANASPIGDMPPVLIALNAKLILRQGEKYRTIDIEDYFTGYKKTQLQPSEFIKEISIPKIQSKQTLKVYKVSKRFDDDISAVLAGFFIEIDNQKIRNIRIAFGGMAATPARANKCESALLGKTINQKTFQSAINALIEDFKPMSDVRASSEYRMKVAQNIIQKFYIELNEQSKLSKQSTQTRLAYHA